MSDQIVTESFSSGYELVHGAEVLTLDDEEAIMDFEMFEALETQFGDPLVGYVDGLHYHFKPEKSIPTSTLAVPALNHDNPDTLLIQR
jgi:hypothetical protein